MAFKKNGVPCDPEKPTVTGGIRPGITAGPVRAACGALFGMTSAGLTGMSNAISLGKTLCPQWTPLKSRLPLHSTADRDNIRWVWANDLRHKSPWLRIVLGMSVVQGLVCQQFLTLTRHRAC